MELYKGQLKNYPYTVERIRNHHKREGVAAFSYRCLDIITLDIEVTSAWLKDGEVIGYEVGHDAEFYNELQPLCLPYIWQLSINEQVFYGREFESLYGAFSDLPDGMDVICWIHNLSYEWHFLANIFTWRNVFARTPHKPMKAVPEEMPHITFRCSYMLTRLSLEVWGDVLGLPKMVGELDYEVIRTPLTELTEKELGYCQRDCEVVYAGIKSFLAEYGDVWNIPLTQTGTVRRPVKDMLLSDDEYHRHVKTLVPTSARMYKINMEIFAGGYTHGNRWYAGEVLREEMNHVDFRSSYPFCMLLPLPDSPWIFYPDNKIPEDSEFEDHAFILHLKFAGLECETFNTYIQGSKFNGRGCKYDNGRVISADVGDMWLTEQDWMTIRDSYAWESLEVLEMYTCIKRYLPKALVNYILDLYGYKTTLKGITDEEQPGAEELYATSKRRLNGIFGMSVTAPIFSDVQLEGDEWFIKPLTEELVEKRLQELTRWYKTEKRYFLNYSVGVWVAALARRHLWENILEHDADVVYADTDSMFVRGHFDIEPYNEKVREMLRKSAKACGYDFERTRPKDRKGNEQPLGEWSREPEICEFITLGAKRYCERWKKDGKLHLTVSGINKGAVACLNDDIENFKDGMNFDKDHPSVHKMLHTYVYDMPEVDWPDGYHSTLNKGINMRRNGYLLTMSGEYRELIQLCQMSLDGLSPAAMLEFRKQFELREEESLEEIL